MFLEIVTPEAILFSSEVNAITLPGVNGEFQILNNHAAIVANLSDGYIKIDSSSSYVIPEKYEDKFVKNKEGKLLFEINSGTLEMNDNKAIVLAD